MKPAATAVTPGITTLLLPGRGAEGSWVCEPGGGAADARVVTCISFTSVGVGTGHQRAPALHTWPGYRLDMCTRKKIMLGCTTPRAAHAAAPAQSR